MQDPSGVGGNRPAAARTASRPRSSGRVRNRSQRPHRRRLGGPQRGPSAALEGRDLRHLGFAGWAIVCLIPNPSAARIPDHASDHPAAFPIPGPAAIMVGLRCDPVPGGDQDADFQPREGIKGFTSPAPQRVTPQGGWVSPPGSSRPSLAGSRVRPSVGPRMPFGHGHLDSHDCMNGSVVDVLTVGNDNPFQGPWRIVRGGRLDTACCVVPSKRQTRPQTGSGPPDQPWGEGLLAHLRHLHDGPVGVILIEPMMPPLATSPRRCRSEWCRGRARREGHGHSRQRSARSG
jgi:hypothetical protein